MIKYIYKTKFLALVTVSLMASCISDDLPGVGDLSENNTTLPTPFYNVTNVVSSEFDCDDVEIFAKYEYNFQAGSNLAVNGTQYEWLIRDENGDVLSDINLVNTDVPVYDLLIEAQKPDVVALEEAIRKLELKIPCEADAAKAAVLNAELAGLQTSLDAANAALSEDAVSTIAGLITERNALPAATLEDRELIIEFPQPGTYTIELTVTDNLGNSETTENLLTVSQAVPTIAIPEIGEPGFEDNTLFDGTGDGRDSWRTPSNAAWSPVGGGTTIMQINTKAEGVLPEGLQAAKFPSDGARVAYQEIEVTPGATYVLTYFSAFNLAVAGGELNVSILKPGTASYTEAQLEENIIASRTDTNSGRTVDVFKQHAITFEAGEHESVIIFVTNSLDETRVDSFAISVKQ